MSEPAEGGVPDLFTLDGMEMALELLQAHHDRDNEKLGAMLLATSHPDVLVAFMGLVQQLADILGWPMTRLLARVSTAITAARAEETNETENP